METVYLIKAVLDGFLIGWGTCYLVGCARAWLKTAASAPRNAPAPHFAGPLHAGYYLHCMPMRRFAA